MSSPTLPIIVPRNMYHHLDFLHHPSLLSKKHTYIVTLLPRDLAFWLQHSSVTTLLWPRWCSNVRASLYDRWARQHGFAGWPAPTAASVVLAWGLPHLAVVEVLSYGGSPLIWLPSVLLHETCPLGLCSFLPYIWWGMDVVVVGLLQVQRPWHPQRVGSVHNVHGGVRGLHNGHCESTVGSRTWWCRRRQI